MKVSVIKKMLLGALTASLVMAPMMSVSASTTNNPSNPVIPGTTSSSSDNAAEEVTTGDSASVSSWIESIPTTSSAGSVRSTTAGVYVATSVNGTAVSTSASSIASSYGLAANEKPYAKFFNLDPVKSHLAKAAIDAAAASQNAEVGPMINIELGKMSGGKYSLLPSDGADIRIAIGIPSNFQRAGKTFAMVCVRAGGAVSILQDVDENPATITFDTKGGAGAYAVIRY